MQQLPEFPEELKELETLIRSTLRPYIELKTELVEEPLSVFTSKIGGDPFWIKDEPYPADSLGYPMFMLAQINFAEMPKLPDFPGDGILQFFVRFGEHFIKFWDTDSLEKERYDNFDFIWKHWLNFEVSDIEEAKIKLLNDFHIIPFNNSLKLIPKLSYTFASPILNLEILDFNYQELSLLNELINENEMWDFLKIPSINESDYDNQQIAQFIEDYNSTFSKGEIVFNSNPNEIYLHNINGHCYSPQGDPREYNLETDVVLLFLDEESRANTMEVMKDGMIKLNQELLSFGDGGTCTFLIQREDLQNKDFSNVIMEILCG